MTGTITMTGEDYDLIVKQARVEGIVAGLEMADKFVALTKSRDDIASMIKVAIATAKG
jgi:hypothetical protein